MALLINSYVISKGLWRIIDDNGLAQIPAEDTQILDVVSVDANAVFAEQPIFNPLAFRI